MLCGDWDGDGCWCSNAGVAAARFRISRGYFVVRFMIHIIGGEFGVGQSLSSRSARAARTSGSCRMSSGGTLGQ
jgi:hypothetical protein